MIRGAFCSSLVLALLSRPASSGDPPAAPSLSAEDIAQRALDNNLFATHDASASLTIRVERRGHLIRERKLRTKMKRSEGLVRALVEFDTPADVAGTRFLSIEEAAGKTQQFIYLPAFKKVKRVVGSQRDKSFMGTDFSFADLEGRDVKASTWKRLPDETIDGQVCFVIEGVPRNRDDEPYGRIVSWVRKDTLVPVAASLYARDGVTLEKRLEVKKLQKKGGRTLATETWMSTPRAESTTKLILTAIDLETELNDDAFRPEALER
ncbi:MAG: outer membrane lipoprotein-sorting protein [Deltaproteobacteria bacterium]|nr:outer membrane lipoprotein-sorting protein [Deltaproteobacteria bacterium]